MSLKNNFQIKIKINRKKEKALGCESHSYLFGLFSVFIKKNLLISSRFFRFVTFIFFLNSRLHLNHT